jgi:site-specific DNA-methyltransferase (adenine-specific)
MEWLVRLATVPGQLILDPFCGGGTTGVAALQLQRMFIGVDIDQTAITQTASRLDELHSKSSTRVLYYFRNVA